MGMRQLLEQIPKRLIEIRDIQCVMALSERIGGQNIAGQGLERLQDIDRLSILLELLQPAKEFLDVIFEQVITSSDVGFGEELRNGSASQAMMVMLRSSYHCLRRVEVRQGPWILVPLLSHFPAVDLVEIRVIHV